jgi:hypothetical protein
MADSGGWVCFQYLLVPHADEDWFAAVQAMRIDADLSAGKEPAHG